MEKRPNTQMTGGGRATKQEWIKSRGQRVRKGGVEHLLKRQVRWGQRERNESDSPTAVGVWTFLTDAAGL